MAATTKAMHQIRQIFELQQQQVSLRKIERLTVFSRNTVRDYVRRAIASGRTLRDSSLILAKLYKSDKM